MWTKCLFLCHCSQLRCCVIKGYYSLLIDFLVHGISKIWKYWEPVGKGLYANKFISNTMGYHKWILIDQCMQADLEWMQIYFEKIMLQLYIPYSELSVDDDLDLWTGKFGKKKHNQRLMVLELPVGKLL